MNYKKHDEIPPIPAHLAQECIDYAENQYAAKAPMVAWYCGYDTTNENSVAYVEPGTELDETNGKETAGIGFYSLPPTLAYQLVSFCKSTNNPLTNFDVIAVQIVGDGGHMSPHIDDPMMREAGLLFMLKEGGSNVVTSWYNIKDEHSASGITYNKAIPYSRLDLVESHRIEANHWHWLDFTKVHSVENKESTRIALWGYKNP